jgi:hypothetical protein
MRVYLTDERRSRRAHFLGTLCAGREPAECLADFQSAEGESFDVWVILFKLP